MARRSSTERDAMRLRAWLAVVRCYNLCDQLLAQRLARLGVRVLEHELMAHLLREPGLSQQALAQRCLAAKSHVSGLVSLLEQRGWLRREPDPADARARRLFLSAEGLALAEQTLAVQAEVIALMAGACSDEAMAALQPLMHGVSQALEDALNRP
jgi:DNA-binding MarR family transcriptional regulator